MNTRHALLFAASFFCLVILGILCTSPVNPYKIPPKGLSYSENPVVYIVGEEISANELSIDEGFADSYAVTPDLPTGLTINSKNGKITGTPTVVSPKVNYTVTAKNSEAETSVILTITVNPVALSGLFYSSSLVQAELDKTFSLAPTISHGTPDSFTVSPALPTGLSIEDQKGIISGIPTELSEPTMYTVKAINAAGYTESMFMMTVVESLVIIDTTDTSSDTTGQQHSLAAPVITQNLDNKQALLGGTVSLSFIVVGDSLSFIWFKDGTIIAGEISSSLQLDSVKESDTGIYYAVVSNTVGSDTTTPCTLTVSASAVAPSITLQPVDQSVTVGDTAVFSVVATGTEPLYYLWQKNDIDISGATTTAFTLNSVVHADSGMYSVKVWNEAGADTSEYAQLTVFDAQRFVLSIAAENGTVSRQPDDSDYAEGSSVRITAEPSTGYKFVQWSGSVSGSTNPLSLTVDSAMNVVAEFSANTYALTIDSTVGSVARTPDQASYEYDTQVSLNAVAPVGYTFSGWTGDSVSDVNPLTIVVKNDQSYTAHFSQESYTVLTPATNGSISRYPDRQTFTYGEPVQLTATPHTGYTFANWTGDTSGQTNPLTVAVKSNMSISALFDKNRYKLTVTSANGDVDADPDFSTDSTYAYQTYVELTATAHTGYEFQGWSGGADGSNNPITVQMNEDKNVVANYSILAYSVDVASVSYGSVVLDPATGPYDYGTEVRVEAVPDPGCKFTGWISGSLSGANNPDTLVMDGNKSVTAQFSKKTYALSINIVGNGIVDKSPDKTLYDHGTVVTLDATPGSGSQFVDWGGDASGTNPQTTVTMDTAKAVTATFEMIPLTYPGMKSYFITNESISTLSPSLSGIVSNYSVSPTLPAGLSLNNSTGQITGTPTVTGATICTVTATNASGTSTVDLHFNIKDFVWLSPLEGDVYHVGDTIWLRWDGFFTGTECSWVYMSVNSGFEYYNDFEDQLWPPRLCMDDPAWKNMPWVVPESGTWNSVIWPKSNCCKIAIQPTSGGTYTATRPFSITN